MKPNQPPNRESLLRMIHQSLAEHSTARSDQHDGTLGAVVRQIAMTFSPKNQTKHQNVNTTPVPLHEVAAYVDGTLDDVEKQNAITVAALTDPGLMMEIVSAVRARAETSSTPKLSSDLRNRLIGLQTASIITPPPIESPVEPPPAPSVQQSIHPAVSLRTVPSETSGNARFNFAAIAAFTAAATLLLAIGWWVRTGTAPEINPIVENPSGQQSRDRVEPSPTSTPQSEPSEDSNASPMLVERPKPKTIPLTDSIDINPGVPLPDEPMPGARDFAPPKNIAQVDPDQGIEPVQPRSPQQSPQRSQRLVAQWTQIDGLLLRSLSSTTPQESRSSGSIPASVSTGNSFELASESVGEKLRLQTLPFCRATAQLDGGGELVLAADTQVELTQGGVIDLQFGSFAILGLSKKRVLHLGRNSANSVSLRSDLGGSIVVRKTVSGMQIDVSGKPVQVDGKTYVDSRLNVQGRKLSASRVDDAPDRLPRWTRERVDRIEVGRNVLGQLSTSTNVVATLLQTLRSGNLRAAETATIRGWLIASSGDNLFRLLGSKDALIREAVLLHLRAVNPTDPRHRSLWRQLQTRGNNPRAFLSIRSYFVELWAGRRPNVTRRDHLLQMLQSPDPGIRVTANYLLRSFYGAGPRFELNSNAATRTRTVTGWQAVIKRTD